ncbi:MAG: class flavin-dependent oxidoreductase [Nocardioides sp.]|nr:class flavin-dependent oxidoreductase [Nocardioides sp.]
MDVGVALPDAGLSVRDVVTLAQEAEAAGVDAVYAVEAVRTATVPLAAIAAGTSVIRFGPYAVNAYARSAGLTALTAIDLAALAGGRLTLCVAAGNRHLNEEIHGVEAQRPATRMAEYLTILRRMLAAEPGQEVRFEGELLRMGPWLPTTPPIHVPVLLAGVQPAMLRTAGRHADGVALGVLHSPEHVAAVVLPQFRAAAEAAGRDPALLRVTLGVSVAVDEDREAARAAVRRMVCALFSPLPHPYYEFAMREQGFASTVDALARLVPEGRWREAVAAVPDELVDTLAVAGDPAASRAALARYDGLVDEVVLVNARGPLDTAEPWQDSNRAVIALAGGMRATELASPARPPSG